MRYRGMVLTSIRYWVLPALVAANNSPIHSKLSLRKDVSETECLQMDNLIKALPAILAASNQAEEVTEAACFSAWKHAVGEGLCANTVPTGFSAGKLEIAVADAIWKAQLESLHTQLQFRLNSLLGGPVVRSLEIRIEPERLKKPTHSVATKPTTGRAIPIELVSAAAHISDPDLRRAFLGAAVSCVDRIEAFKGINHANH